MRTSRCLPLPFSGGHPKIDLGFNIAEGAIKNHRKLIRNIGAERTRNLKPNKPRGIPRVNDRRVLNGIFWVLRSGAPWRDLPERYGPYTNRYNRFVRWRKAVELKGRLGEVFLF